jgi:hypothetical protein
LLLPIPATVISSEPVNQSVVVEVKPVTCEVSPAVQRLIDFLNTKFVASFKPTLNIRMFPELMFCNQADLYAACQNIAPSGWVVKSSLADLEKQNVVEFDLAALNNTAISMPTIDSTVRQNIHSLITTIRSHNKGWIICERMQIYDTSARGGFPVTGLYCEEHPNIDDRVLKLSDQYLYRLSDICEYVRLITNTMSHTNIQVNNNGDQGWSISIAVNVQETQAEWIAAVTDLSNRMPLQHRPISKRPYLYKDKTESDKMTVRQFAESFCTEYAGSK